MLLLHDKTVPTDGGLRRVHEKGGMGEQPTAVVMDNSIVIGFETVASSIASLRATGKPELNPFISFWHATSESHAAMLAST